MKNKNEQPTFVADTNAKNQVVMPTSFLYNLKQVVYIFFAALATAISLEVFLLPGKVVIGGALGVASSLDILLSGNSKLYFSAGVWLMLINIPIVVYCFVSLRKRFAVKTLLYIVMLSALLILLRLLNVSEIFAQLMYGSGEKDKVINVILGGALHGISLPIMLSVNASTGGTDIVGIMVQKRSKQSSNVAMRMILLSNVLVALVASVLLYFVDESASEAVNMFIYSVAALFICEIVQEWIFSGFSAAYELEITTEKPEEMVAQLNAGLKHGTTTLNVKGGYSHQEKSMILCVVNRRQLTLARKIINQVDPSAFAYVENVKEVLGKGFANKETGFEEE